MLPEWSPPVPTMSMTSISCVTGCACSRIAAADPEISSIVSIPLLFVESAAR